jgi:ferrous iron transport protein B
MAQQIQVALIGNPNTGKTSVFNRLTGLNQKVGNYPGITVEKKEGICPLSRGKRAHVLDLPGTYSLNASSIDENQVIELLLNKNDKDYPDVAVVVCEIENLKRNLLLFTQIKDLKIPTILAINMVDRMQRKAISLDVPALEQALKTKVVLISSRKNQGFDDLKATIEHYKSLPMQPCLDMTIIAPEYFERLRKAYPNQDIYKLWLVITQDVNFGKLDRTGKAQSPSFQTESVSTLKALQQKETIKRYQYINDVLKTALVVDKAKAKDFRSRLDRVLTHPKWGYVIFFAVLMLMFQAIFDWSSYPMDLIEVAFAQMSEWIKRTLPIGDFTNLLAEGVVPGLGGIVIFIPQIAFLFLFIAVLEETGYMSRVVFLMDRIMRRFGLSGKSVVPLVSGTACAIPAIMATRNIENWKERLITILVTPFTTCSARLPVYLIIISLIIPEYRVLGLFSLQGLTLTLLYFLGFASAIVSAFLLDRFLKVPSRSFFLIEMPNYKVPILKNVLVTMIEKTKSFVFGAGKIILAISIILWVLASYGPGDFNRAEEIVTAEYTNENSTEQDRDLAIVSYKLEHSYIGILGKGLEPLVAPLGYDWKIGIALVSSFAAREVFVGTLATIYSVGNDSEETIRNRMAAEINPVSGEPRFNFASGVSLLLFYAFAMQCMSTLAVVRRETNSWKWPLYQLIFMSTLAYIVALAAYQFLK